MLDKKKSSSPIRVNFEVDSIRGKTLIDSHSEKGGDIISVGRLAEGSDRTKTAQGFHHAKDAFGGKLLIPEANDENSSSITRKNTSRINKNNVTDIEALKEKKEQEQKDPKKIYVDDETAK